MLEDAGTRAKFAHPEAGLGVIGVGLVQPGREFGELAAVPAVVAVERDDIRVPVFGSASL